MCLYSAPIARFFSSARIAVSIAGVAARADLWLRILSALVEQVSVGQTSGRKRSRSVRVILPPGKARQPPPAPPRGRVAALGLDFGIVIADTLRLDPRMRRAIAHVRQKGGRAGTRTPRREQHTPRANPSGRGGVSC